MEVSMPHKLFLVTLAIACCLAATPSAAQDDSPRGQLISVHEDVVIPSTVERYEQAAKALSDMITKSGMTSISYTAASMDNFTYIYFSPVENLAAIDKMGESWSELEKKVGKQTFDNAMKGFDGCYPSHRNYLVRLRPDLSYNPGYGAGMADSMYYRSYDYYYIHPGMEEAAENVAKEWVALNKKVGMPDGYRLYSGSFGTDGPLFIVVQSARNAAEFGAQQAEWMKKAGDETMALMAKTWKVVRKFDTTRGRIRPELSAMPKDIMIKK
jgi:hypothetical protein